MIVVCLFTLQLSLVIIAPTQGGMTKLVPIEHSRLVVHFLSCLVLILRLRVKTRHQLGFRIIKNFGQETGFGLSRFMTFPEYGMGTKCKNQIFDRRAGNR